MSRVCILDYGSGNVKSVSNLFTSIVGEVVVSNDPADIEKATHIVLPGVGAFGAAMRRIRETLPLDVLRRRVMTEKTPFLGICVGMQVLADRGVEFGEHPGLGWVPGSVNKLDSKNLPLPHVGWNGVAAARTHPLLAGLENEPDFYFVHSFVFHAADPNDVLATTDYGEDFCSVVQKGNLYGVQFHPEKSQRAGMKLAKNFLAIA
jgi:glutamine amidotransferase